MDIDLQKGSMWKRISAFLFDGILIGILVVALGVLLSVILDYDGYHERLNAAYADYESRYGVTFSVTAEEYAAMDDQSRAVYEEAYQALIQDEEVLYIYNMVLNLTLIITTGSILLSYLFLEFAVPLLLGNGQTLGKKIFSLCLIRGDCVRVNAMQLFARTILGKFTIETMIPVYILIMLYFNTVGLGGTLVLLALLLVQIILLAATRNRSAIHDLLAGTVVADLASQRIFQSAEEKIEYTKRIHAEEVARKPY